MPHVLTSSNLRRCYFQPAMTLELVSTPASAAAPESHAISKAKLLANGTNAQLSTGPTSPEGKARSSLNALKTGLTGRTVLLPTEDAAA